MADIPAARQFDLTLREALCTSSPTVGTSLRYLMRARGKRIRPQLVHLAASFGAPSPQAITDVAVAAELIHLASLVHDDILDEATLRRGQPALHILRGVGHATLVGDFLFSRAFCLLAPYAACGALHTMTEAIARMCEGELEERAHRWNFALDEEQYLVHSEKKTGALIAACVRAGAQLGGLPIPEQERLYRYGVLLGIAYQITDDLLDFTANSQALGKPAGLDLRRGVITLPVIYALHDPTYGPQLKALLKTDAGGGEVAEASRILAEAGATTRAAEKARSLLRQARTQLGSLPLSPARVKMQKITHDVARRLPDPSLYSPYI